MRKTLALAVALAVPALVFAAPSASAYCDPKYKPACLNDCQLQLPDPQDPFRACPR